MLIKREPKELGVVFPESPDKKTKYMIDLHDPAMKLFRDLVSTTESKKLDDYFLTKEGDEGEDDFWLSLL